MPTRDRQLSFSVLLRKKKTESETKEEILTMTMSRWFIDTRIKANSAALTAVHSGLIFNRYSRYNIIPQSNPITLFHYLRDKLTNLCLTRLPLSPQGPPEQLCPAAGEVCWKAEAHRCQQSTAERQFSSLALGSGLGFYCLDISTQPLLPLLFTDSTSFLIFADFPIFRKFSEKSQF